MVVRDKGETMKLRGKKIVVLVADGFEDLEYWVTVMRLREEGAEVISVGPGEGPFHGKNYLEARADATANHVTADGLDGRHHMPRWARGDLRRHRRWRQRDGLARHQRRPRERRGDLGGQARVPREQPRLGACRARHTGLLPRAGRGSLGRLGRKAGHAARRTGQV